MLVAEKRRSCSGAPRATRQPAENLVAEHQRMVVQLAMNLLGDRDEALDLSQDVFLRVFRTIHRFRGQSSLQT